jgi:hypothetical protein
MPTVVIGDTQMYLKGIAYTLEDLPPICALTTPFLRGSVPVPDVTVPR